MNKIILKGRLTNSPEQRFIRDEISVTRFGIAVNRQFSKEKEQKTDFINIVAWNKLGEFVKNYFDKGQEILIVGRLETNQYVDKDTQKKLTSYEVVAEEIEFVGAKKDKKENNEDNSEFEFNENDIPMNVSFGNDDDLPF